MVGHVESGSRIARFREELRDLRWHILDYCSQGERTDTTYAVSPEGMLRNIGWRFDASNPEQEGWYDLGPIEDS